MSKRNSELFNLPSISYVGAGDLGSNKFHFVVCNQYGLKVDHLGYVPALADGMSEMPPFFSKQAMRDATKFLREAAAMFQKYNIEPEQVDCVGTAALRDAQKALMAIIATGEKRKIELAKEQLLELRQAFFPYSFRIISEREEGELVAEAAIKDLYRKPTPAIIQLTKVYPIITVAHCGGRSTEIIDLKTGGEIKKKSVLHFGVHTHKKADQESRGDLPPDIELLNEELLKKWALEPKNDYQPRLLAVSGGNWRANLNLACKILGNDKGTCVFSRDEVLDALPFLAQQSPDYFRLMKVDEKRVEHMAAGARSLQHLIQYVDADEVVLLKGKMVSVLADQLCQKYFMQQEPESQQPVSLLTP